jgi:hypothetical protein
MLRTRLKCLCFWHNRMSLDPVQLWTNSYTILTFFWHSSPVRLTTTGRGTTTSISFKLLSRVLASLLPCELLGWNEFGASKCRILKLNSVLELQSMQLLLREISGMYETLTWHPHEICYNVKAESGLYLIKHHPMKSGGTDPLMLNLGTRPR